ncbi:MAG: RNA-binding S4 domain-containing protein [Acidimicrobiales bacterium]
MEDTRADQWLWAVRLYKTRSAATEACRGGHVRVNGSPAKAATPVRTGDQLEVQLHGWKRNLEVVTPIEKRVGAPAAAAAYIDHSPPRPPREEAVSVFVREVGAGRPTKRDRRQLDRFRT